MHLHQYAFSWSLFLTDYPKCIGKPKPILSQMPLNDAWPQKRDFRCNVINYFQVSQNLLVYRIQIQLSTCLLTLSHASGSSPSTLPLGLARPPPPPLLSELTSQKKNWKKFPPPVPVAYSTFDNSILWRSTRQPMNDWVTPAFLVRCTVYTHNYKRTGTW